MALLACGRPAPPAPAVTPPPYAGPVFGECPLEEATFAMSSLIAAIEVGAPVYNDGDHAGCYRMYLGTASDVVAELEHCPGVKLALEHGMATARSQATYTQRAWAMRYAFDALLEAFPSAPHGEQDQPAQPGELGPR